MKIIISGAAGLVGQNLVLMLREKGYTNIIAIDKHQANLVLLKKLNPDITALHADISEMGLWSINLKDADYVIMLHAQITGIYYNDFLKNNIKATENLLEVINQYHIPYTIHISSSVVNSIAKDFYTNSKAEQEKIVINSGITHCILRPTLMFGWFDPKHLGWLSRFMEKVPIFPIPGNGKYLRQPLYSRDFCKIIIAAMENQPCNKIFDIVGNDQIDYIDMIKTIKKSKKLNTIIVKVPYRLFYILLKTYSLIDKKPPFTADQLTSLTAGDYFIGVDALKLFGVKMTRFQHAIEETFNHPIYSKIHISR